MSDEWRTLHPASVLVNLVPRAWGTVRMAWPLLLAALYGRISGGGIFDLLLVGGLFGFAASTTVLHWATLRYRLVEGRLEIRTGLVWRQVRVISADRVQNVETVRNVFHRLSGLVEVRIETASGTEVEGLLSALSEEEAAELARGLTAARGTPGATVEPERVVLENTWMDVFWYGVTGTRLSAAAVVGGLLYELLVWQDPTELPAMDLLTSGPGLFVVVAFALSGAFVMGLGGAVLRYARFRLLESDRTLIAEEGLFTRRRVELDRKRVQMVSITEPLVRRSLGFGSIHVDTASAREEGDGTQHGEAVLPVVETPQLEALVQRIGGVTLPTALGPPADQALRRALVTQVVRTVGITVVGVLLFGWAGLSGVFVLPPLLGVAWLDHRGQGFGLSADALVCREGYVQRTTRVVPRRKVQSTELVDDPLLRRWGIARLWVRVAGGAVRLPLLRLADAARLQRELTALPTPPPSA